MSHYSNYQASHYRKLFNKYASHESSRLALPDLYLLMVCYFLFLFFFFFVFFLFYYQLFIGFIIISVFIFFFLKVQFGNELSMEQLKLLVYQYDSSRMGLLDFDDFLLLLADYEACRKNEKERIEKAFSHFQRVC